MENRTTASWGHIICGDSCKCILPGDTNSCFAEKLIWIPFNVPFFVMHSFDIHYFCLSGFWPIYIEFFIFLYYIWSFTYLTYVFLQRVFLLLECLHFHVAGQLVKEMLDSFRLLYISKFGTFLTICVASYPFWILLHDDS